ncbi:MAG: phosphate/phosphite/phosphonate ABC transporter substrate-binding protein [Candidatus Velthaea sp.]
MNLHEAPARAQLSRRTLLLSAGAAVVAAGVPRRAAAAAPMRIGMIPDAGATQVSTDQKKPLRDYLAAKLGRDVDLIIPTNYNATVEALGNGTLDFAYLGGLTYVKARAAYGVVPLVQRASDREFHSLFITQTGTALAALKDLRRKKFAFGDINSTSGHLMPYYAMTQAGLDPDKDLSYRYTGNHPATAKAVEAGIVDAGAIDESVFHAMIDGAQLDKAKVRVFYTTPPFLDYVWVARKETPAVDRAAFSDAFLGLRAPADAHVLEILRGTAFVRANDAEYGTLRMVARKLKLL